MSTMPPRPTNEFEELVTQVAWVRNLALAIVRDARGSRDARHARSANDVHTADDLAQEAWVAALRRRPDASEPLGAWFSRVMRNLVRFKTRSDARRVDRERIAARSESEAPALHALERFETQELLLRAVRELDEPYRTTVILRWFEELEPAEIARRANVPVRTVHTRITRALRMLREKLDRESRGDRAKWMSAWIPLLSKPAAPWPWIIAMDVKLKIAIAGVAAVGALTALYFGLQANEMPLAARSMAQDARAAELESPPAAHESETSRTIIGEKQPSEPSAPAIAAQAADPTLLAIDATVLDPLGTPLVDLDVEFRASASSSPIAHARSGSDGSLHFGVKSSNGTLAPASSEWTAVLQPKIRPSKRATRYVLVVAHPIAIAGIVVDERKRPIAGAEVRCSPPPIRERLHLVLDDCAWVAWKSTSDANGRFELPIVPAMTDAQLVTEAAGFTRDARDMPIVSRTDVEIQLTWPPDVASHIRGRVVDARNVGVPGAHVALGTRSVRTDGAGRFDLDLDRAVSFAIATASKDGAASKKPSAPAEARTLRALKQGFLPVELECATPSPRDIGAWPNPLLLVLDKESLAISGRVVDDLGAPVAFADVRVLELTSFGEVDLQFEEKRLPQFAMVESLLSTRSDGQMAWLTTKTDAAGRFVHDGLLPRSYRLRAFDPTTMSVVFTKPCPAPQSDLEIVLSNPSRYPKIAGRVIDRDEHPIAGAIVTPWISYSGSADRIGLYGQPVAADADGRFELRELSRDVDELSVMATGAPGAKHVRLANESNVEAITVRLPRSCHLQVDLTGSTIEADSFEVRDEKGKALMLSMSNGVTIITGPTSFPLVDGHSEALGASDDAHTLVLQLHGEKVAEIPLHLVPDQLNVVRP
jgi:RNA polymerase sigma-70 factor (ECF subfamily)